MRAPLLALILALTAIACAGHPQAATPQAASIEIVLPELVPDLQLATCVADRIASDAERQANRRSQSSAGASISDAIARTRVEQAERAFASAARNRMRARSTALASPGNQSAQANAMVADGRAAYSLAWLRASEQRRIASARAAQEVAGSTAQAHRFAELAKAHETLFLVAGRGTVSSNSSAIEEKALASIHAIATAHRDLEWLYADRFVTTYDDPLTPCD